LNQGNNSNSWYRDHTVLHDAAYWGNMNILEIGVLILIGRVNMVGQHYIVEILLIRDIDINTKTSSSYTALYLAASNGYMNIVEILLNRGIDINSKDSDGNAALHDAASTNCDTYLFFSSSVDR